MSLLGESQTFLGVLVSLIVLCVLIDKSNFMHEILKEIGGGIKDEIQTLNDNISFDKVFNVKEKYKELQDYISNYENTTTVKLIEAIRLDMKMKIAFDQIKTQYSDKFLKTAQDSIEKISTLKEQVSAPLYVLLFCLVIFICDELTTAFPFIQEYIVTFLSVLTLLSFALWTIIWLRFYSDITVGKQNIISIPDSSVFNNRLNLQNTCFLFVISYIIFLIISLFIPPPYLKKILGLGLGIGIPIVVIIFFKLSRNIKSFYCSYEFCFRHFFILFSLSCLITFITILGRLLPYNIQDAYIVYENFNCLKSVIIIFIIGNGLIMPFIMPFLGYKKILNFVKKEKVCSRKASNTNIDSLKEELNVFLKDIQ